MTHRVYSMLFKNVYPLYVQKVLRKEKDQSELDDLIMWLTGYNEKQLNELIESDITMEAFFMNAPQINPKANEIKGMICGVRIEELEDERMRRIRYLDKIVDELAKGKKIEKIKRV